MHLHREHACFCRTPSPPPLSLPSLQDFGLAATMDPSATHISNYNSGTPFYVAPEVASTHKASKASDIFSFGVMMWELHGGQPPWVRVPDRDGSARASYAPNPAFPGWRRDAPRRFISLAMHCLNADPKARPHVGEVRQARLGSHGWGCCDPVRGVMAVEGVHLFRKTTL